MKAIAKHIRISPKKANLVAGLVRNKNAEEALNILKFTPKKAAPILYKVLHSAIANAENNYKQKRDALVVKEIIVTQGATLKRSVPVSRGRVHPILKRTSHITVTVGLAEGQGGAKTKPQSEPTDTSKTSVLPKKKEASAKKTKADAHKETAEKKSESKTDKPKTTKS